MVLLKTKLDSVSGTSDIIDTNYVDISPLNSLEESNHNVVKRGKSPG